MKFFYLILIFCLKSNPLLSSDFIDKGFYVIDLKNKIEWLKCSAGQQWSDSEERCLGVPVKLDQNEIKEANKQLNEQIEGEWRLPTRKEIRKFGLQ